MKKQGLFGVTSLDTKLHQPSKHLLDLCKSESSKVYALVCVDLGCYAYFGPFHGINWEFGKFHVQSLNLGVFWTHWSVMT